MSAAKARPPRVLTPTPDQAPATQVARKKRSLRVRGSTLSWLVGHAFACGIVLSILAHALLLALHFIDVDSGLRKARDPGLQVVLVNARHKQAPKDPQALAQANLEGGGDQADKKLMPSSPLPPQDTVRNGDALISTQQKVQQLEAIQRELMARAKASEANVARERQSKTDDQPAEAPPVPRGLDLSTKSAMQRQEAVVEKRLNDYAARPRKTVISPSTKEYKLAQYSEDWRIKVQRVGELNFPRSERGSLYGSVQIAVELQPDGSIISAEITRPSPNAKLNQAALRIVQLAAPFARFPPDIRKESDVLVIVRTLTFTREDIGVDSR